MKIDNSEQIMKTLHPGSRTPTSSSGDGRFGAILKETVENTQKSSPAMQNTQFVTAPVGLRLDPATSVASDSPVGQVENLLDLLDRYRLQLADSKVSLKQLDSLVQEMSAEKQRLKPVLDKLPDADKLKGILNQTLITTSVEIARFYRGDYIAS